MGARLDIKPKSIPKNFYAEPIPVEKKRLIMWHQSNKFSSRDGVYWDAHGFKFDEGVVYEVNNEVFEFVKRQRGFFEVADIRIKDVVKFK